MEKIDKNKVYDMFMEWSKENPGTWVDRSKNVAEVAGRVAKALGLDEAKAYAMGLLYDIGRVKGSAGVRHTFDGYHFLKEEGYDEIARVCITHAFITQDVTNTIGEYDMTNDEYDFIRRFLREISFDEYDTLIQLADSMALPDRIVLVETRLMDVCLRYGIDEKAAENIKAIYDIQLEIEEKLGHSIYKLFPEIGQTFDSKMLKDVFKF